MAYGDRVSGSNRIVSITIVALIHAVLGYAFVTGLAPKIVQEKLKDLNVFDVQDEPPPPEEEPPPPPPETPQEVQPPPLVTPPPIVRTPVQQPPLQSVNTPPPAAPVNPFPPQNITPAPPAAVPPPPPPPPPPPVTVQQPQLAAGSLQGLIRNEDYPDAAAQRGDQGTTVVRLTIGTNGRVTACSGSGSGSSILDSAACRIIRSRARYTPARDNAGNPTTGNATGRITWRLADE